MAHDDLSREVVCPPNVGIRSFHTQPWLVELPGAPYRPPPNESAVPPAADPPGPHADWCDTRAAASLGTLERTYGSRIKAGLIELSASGVVRSENPYNADERRLALRKHVFAWTGPPPSPPDRPALGHYPVEPGDRFHQYLGFVDLRSVWQKAPLALGVLAVPNKFARDPATRVITGCYGPLFGGPAFTSTVYSMQDPGASGAYCAETAMLMALALLADRGARLDGSHTLSFRGSAKQHYEGGGPADCVARSAATRPAWFYEVGNLTPEACFKVLGHTDYRVSPDRIVSSDPGRVPPRLADLVVRAYLDARFPVILGVDAHEWAKGRDPDPPEPGKVGHAVVVVGYRVTGPAAEDVSWLVHDPSDRPFLPRKLGRCLAAAWAVIPNPGEPGQLNLLPVADHNVGVHLWPCVEFLRTRANQVWFNVWTSDAPAGPHHDEAVRELRGMIDTFERYATSAATAGVGYHLRAGLVDPTACRTFFQDEGSGPAVDKLADRLAGVIGRLPGRRYWCLAGYQATGGQPARVRHVWLFNAEMPKRLDLSPGPALELALYVGESVVVLRGAFLRRTPVRPPPPPGAPAERDPPAAGSLTPAVMTSCSTRPLGEFAAEVREVGGVDQFDVILLREIDLDRFLRRGGREYERPAQDRTAGPPPNRVTRFLAEAEREECGELADWIAAQFAAAAGSFPVAALATHLPGVTSLTEDTRQVAVKALANCVRVGLRLRERGWMREVVVELVCGSILDRCGCTACTPANPDPGAGAPSPEGGGPAVPRCHVSTPKAKLDLLAKSLREVIAAVADRGPAPRFALGLELEPGPTFVLNDRQAIADIMAVVEADARLADHVGLNLDVAHMRIAGVTAAELRPWWDRIVHGHIADHPPGMHTRDQPPGTWTPVYTPDSAFHPYVKLLADRAEGYVPNTGLPFSGAVAIELEGCERIDYVFQSIPPMKHLVRVARNYA